MVWYSKRMARTASKNGSIAVINQKAAAMGRPSNYRKEYDQVALDHMAGFDTQGDWNDIDITKLKLGTLRGLAARLDISPAVLYEWKKNIKEFDYAIEKGKALQEEIMAQRLIVGVGQTAGTIFALKNLHSWADRQEVHTTVSMNDRISDHLKGGNRVDWDKGEIVQTVETSDGVHKVERWDDDADTNTLAE